MKFKPTKEDQKRIDMLKRLTIGNPTKAEILDTVKQTIRYFETRYGFNPLETDNNKTDTPETK